MPETQRPERTMHRVASRSAMLRAETEGRVTTCDSGVLSANDSKHSTCRTEKVHDQRSPPEEPLEHVAPRDCTPLKHRLHSNRLLRCLSPFPVTPDDMVMVTVP